MRKTFIIYFSSIMLSSISIASAADVVWEQEPAAAPLFSWGGPYIGAQIGYGWGKSNIELDNNVTLTPKPKGFLGGLYAGYNFDVGSNFILGVDGDITYTNMRNSFDWTIAGITLTDRASMRWAGAVRARIGYAYDRVLPYLAGGVAFGNFRNSVQFLGTTIASSSETYTGYTVGGGLDYAATNNIILRLEYRYTDYGTNAFAFRNRDNDIDFKTNEVRVGVAYKF